jgi:aminoglycoside phosphotransferase (APT) family kinase protein
VSHPPPVIDAALARRLVDRQFPQWSDLPIAGVAVDGWDNRTFRLGAELTVRLPSGPWYAAQVEKEQRWLPVLAPQVTLPIPTPVAEGAPDAGFPYPWSVYRWLAATSRAMRRSPTCRGSRATSPASCARSGASTRRTGRAAGSTTSTAAAR